MLAIFAFFSLFIFSFRTNAQCATDFDWSSLTPSTVLNWTDCYTNGLQCTRLSVPLDYANGTDERATIAMVRIPSPFGLNGSSEYRGPLLFNPGGPGESGVDFLTGPEASTLQTRLGDKYDIVGFDPRGVGRSTPAADVFGSTLRAALWGENSLQTTLPPLSQPGNVGLTLAKAQIANTIYGQTGASYLSYINTPWTAQDMLQIVKAHGIDEVNYYGISYGTVLGAVFATMFPQNVGKMILDGVADTEAYFAGNVTANLLSTDAALNVFFQSCFAAGPDLCAFYDSSPGKISANLGALYEQLKAAPIPATDGVNYGVVDYSLVRHLVRASLYSPYSSFASLAEGFALAAQGNASLLFSLGYTPLSNSPCNCSKEDPTINNVNTFLTVSCNDADTQNKTISEWEAFYEAAANVSAYADVWAGTVMRCSAWPVTTKNPARGPWGGNTSTPILFIGNTFDPVTPFAGAQKMSSLFSGSGLLKQNSTGHTSISASSECTTNVVVRYLENMTLPDAGAICQVEGDIFSA
ncbi:alpha/beta hydrolase fold-domain-containing protein [Vararia minispora EC-137]|uniref:Alpha/beta hydrolase fold-domain-containing protein n=1 Tax=Vararia minispora EC-137 TaxID=1314806 RepID=A0ACB8QHL2_9AGAM|nr:alpha/beta hydrolase fold-domain-containing protein [Vararia minispora EC-137]